MMDLGVKWWWMMVAVTAANELGCYRVPVDEVLNTHNSGQSGDVCMSACAAVYFRFALVVKETCLCGNRPGQQLPAAACDTRCAKNDTQRCGGEHAASVYDTLLTAPGPVAALSLVNVTETTVRIKWLAPQAYTFITEYVVRAHVLETFADFSVPPLEWRVSNSTFQSELLNLQPGSMYSVSVAAVNYDEEGLNVSTKAETVIGTPDPSPPDIEIKERHGDRMVVHIPKAKNVLGPVTMYRIVVSIQLYQQGYIPDYLHDYHLATAEGLPYYITAEIDPGDIQYDFTIGDRNTYNGFYNAPLPLTNDIQVSLGVVSEKNNVRKIRYADSSKKIMLKINEPEEVSGLVVGLGAGVGVGSLLLVAAAGLLLMARRGLLVRPLHATADAHARPCHNAAYEPDARS